MGYHIVVRKKGMTREDIRRLLDSPASYVGLACFLKETRYDDFARLSGDSSRFALMFSKVTLDKVPDEWIDYDGEVVFNNIGFSAVGDIERVLGFAPPLVDSDAYDEKRSHGGRGIVIRPFSAEEEDSGEWMTAEELRSKLLKKEPIAEAESGASWVFPTFQAIADGGFDCRILA
jgi:hypothetical protein